MPPAIAYKTYWLTSSLRHFARERITSAGGMVIGCIIVSALLGLDTNRTLAFQAFTLLTTLFFFAILFSFSFKARFGVNRDLPRFCTAGEPFKYRITIRSFSDKAMDGLSLMEKLADPRPSFAKFQTLREPGEEQRNRFDTVFGFYRWNWYIEQRRNNPPPERVLPLIPPGGEITVDMEMTPLKRGVIRFDSTGITRRDPFGLLRSLVNIKSGQSVVVLPNRYKTADVRLPGVRKYNQGGVALASHVGDSEEFMSLRDYRAGDPLRKIHWASWAKSGKPVVKEYQEEYFSRHALILDTFGDGGKIFEEAVSVAASFVASVDTGESFLDLMFVGTKAYRFTSGRGMGGGEPMLEILSSVKACTDKHFSLLEKAVIERAPILSGCVCVFLQFDEERQNFVKRLIGMGGQLRVFVVTDDETKIDAGPMKSSPDRFTVLEYGSVKDRLSNL